MSYEKSIIGSLMLDPRAIESVKALEALRMTQSAERYKEYQNTR